MAVLAGRRRSSAEAVLDREYAALRAPTLAALRTKLGTSGLRFDDVDLEAFYNQAWHGLYLHLAEDEPIENHGGFLVQASYRRAIEEVRRLHPERRADAVDLTAVGSDIDLPAQLDDHTQLRHFMEGMRERLDDRERAAVTLCYIQGCSRPEAAELLGVSPQRMEKLMDGASRKVAVLVEDIREGSWCDTRESLMKAYAFGVLDPHGERWALADAHLRECSGCRGYVRGLRGVAAVAPPAGLALALLGALGLGAGAAVAAAGGAASGGAGGAAAGAGSAGAGGGIGTAGIAAAASLAVAAGGFGVYTVASHQSHHAASKPAAVVRTTTVRPATPPGGAAAPAAAKKPARPAQRRPARRIAATSTATPATAPTAAPTTAPATTTAPAARPAPTTKQPTQDGAQEFGFER